MSIQSANARVLNSSEKTRERKIPEPLSLILCERQALESDFMSHGIFDAQIEVTTLRAKKPSSKITAQIARRRALEIAEAGEQLGYSFGICADGSAWVVTFPSPSEVVLNGSDLQLPASAKTICTPNSLRVLFSAELKGRSMTVPVSADLKARIPSQRGFVSVICNPNMFADSGPREWFLYSSAGLTPKKNDSFLSANESLEVSILNWINLKRQGEGLAVVSMDKNLEAAAKVLAQQKRVRHNLSELAGVKADLAKKSVEPLGEDRAMGNTIADIAGLLWRSPSHRDLLLSPAGELAGVAVSKTRDGGLMAVLLIGKKSSPGSLAKYLQ